MNGAYIGGFVILARLRIIRTNREGTTARRIIKRIETMTIKAYRKESDTLALDRYPRRKRPLHDGQTGRALPSPCIHR